KVGPYMSSYIAQQLAVLGPDEYAGGGVRRRRYCHQGKVERRLRLVLRLELHVCETDLSRGNRGHGGHREIAAGHARPEEHVPERVGSLGHLVARRDPGRKGIQSQPVASRLSSEDASPPQKGYAVGAHEPDLVHVAGQRGFDFYLFVRFVYRLDLCEW